MAFSATQYESMYKRMMLNLGKPVTLRYNNGTGWDDYPGITAYVTRYREDDIVQGGSIEVGDLRLIVVEDYMPAGLRDMERKDRIDIDGRNYSVVHFDKETRAMGPDIVAIEIAVRG
jgi:hypothetical protein